MENTFAQLLGGHFNGWLILEVLGALFGLETIRLAIAELAALLLEKRTEKWILRRKARKRKGAHLHKLLLMRVKRATGQEDTHRVVRLGGNSHV